MNDNYLSPIFIEDEGHDNYALIAEQFAETMAAWGRASSRWDFASDETKAAEDLPPLPPPKRSRVVVSLEM